VLLLKGFLGLGLGNVVTHTRLDPRKPCAALVDALQRLYLFPSVGRAQPQQSHDAGERSALADSVLARMETIGLAYAIR
jgi:hypothetical protein